MGCPKLDIRSQFYFTGAEKKPHSREETADHTQKTAYSRFSHTVISNHRYYSPQLGRWLSRDPIAERGGLNLYAMVANNPVNAWDERGLRGPDTPECWVARDALARIITEFSRKIYLQKIVVSKLSPIVAGQKLVVADAFMRYNLMSSFESAAKGTYETVSFLCRMGIASACRAKPSRKKEWDEAKKATDRYSKEYDKASDVLDSVKKTLSDEQSKLTSLEKEYQSEYLSGMAEVEFECSCPTKCP